eukprot:gene12977-26601_t
MSNGNMDDALAYAQHAVDDGIVAQIPTSKGYNYKTTKTKVLKSSHAPGTVVVYRKDGGVAVAAVVAASVVSFEDRHHVDYELLHADESIALNVSSRGHALVRFEDVVIANHRAGKKAPSRPASNGIQKLAKMALEAARPLKRKRNGGGGGGAGGGGGGAAAAAAAAAPSGGAGTVTPTIGSNKELQIWVLRPGHETGQLTNALDERGVSALVGAAARVVITSASEIYVPMEEVADKDNPAATDQQTSYGAWGQLKRANPALAAECIRIAKLDAAVVKLLLSRMRGVPFEITTVSLLLRHNATDSSLTYPPQPPHCDASVAGLVHGDQYQMLRYIQAHGGPAKTPSTLTYGAAEAAAATADVVPARNLTKRQLLIMANTVPHGAPETVLAPGGTRIMLFITFCRKDMHFSQGYNQNEQITQLSAILEAFMRLSPDVVGVIRPGLRLRTFKEAATANPAGFAAFAPAPGSVATPAPLPATVLILAAIPFAATMLQVAHATSIMMPLAVFEHQLGESDGHDSLIRLLQQALHAPCALTPANTLAVALAIARLADEQNMSSHATRTLHTAILCEEDAVALRAQPMEERTARHNRDARVIAQRVAARTDTHHGFYAADPTLTVVADELNKHSSTKMNERAFTARFVAWRNEKYPATD